MPICVDLDAQGRVSSTVNYTGGAQSCDLVSLTASEAQMMMSPAWDLSYENANQLIAAAVGLFLLAYIFRRILKML